MVPSYGYRGTTIEKAMLSRVDERSHAYAPSRPAMLSRRHILRAGIASLTLWPACWRGLAADLEPLSLVVVSDTHLGYRDQNEAAEIWARAAEEISAGPGDLVLHLGDVVDGGRAEQYPKYLEIRQRIRQPVHEIPGNHDPEELFRQHLRDPVSTAIDYQWLRLLLINNSRRDSHDGFVSAEQLGWLDEQLQDTARQGKYAVLCMHVPAHSNGHPDRGWYVKAESGQRELYELVSRHRARLVGLFHGHFHNGIRGWEDHEGVAEVAFPSVLYNLDRRLEAQGAPGFNPSEFRPGYTLATISGGSLQLQYKPIGHEPSVERRCQWASA